MIKPQLILEIGTFTGYSAICLCEGLKKSGQLHTIEINDELEKVNAENFKLAKVDHLITAHFGNAIDIIPKLGIQFDLIFIDADKVNYCNYFDLALQNLKVGGFILADNVLWGGKVLQDSEKKLDKDTQAVKEFNELVNREPSVENIMIPLRDGMTLIQKLQ
jgi:predicted O-methyltransferase YrrM